MFARARSFRPLVNTARRSLSTSTPASPSYRRVLIGATATTIAVGSLFAENRRVLNDDKVRESVLDQDSLKRPIHKRDSQPQETNEKSSVPSSSSGSSSEPPKTKAQTHPETIADKATNLIDEKITSKNHDVSQSVLDQPSLKANVHKREAAPTSQESTQSGDAAKVVEEKSEEAAQPSQGAFNEETGEINWDCPCLGGMADGPCGEDFKAAFSCFIFSEAEPKGVDCVEKFKHMQDCFRAHPDIYGAEIDDDEATDNEPTDAPAAPAAEEKQE